MIPEAAVEAAAKGVAGAAYGLWELVPEPKKRLFLRDARLALEAAAPHLLAGAWDRGFLFAYYLERGYEDDGTMPTPAQLAGDLDEWNPHRPTK